ncbi:SixA phosphatase family protein [Jannaschia ovalis]|uniref:Phosphoglycerate mutase family protein n=1 Tax=Jannaschia ovalis TaxID=3038773 RepID=A0ABY8L9U5_9RHOB|nr:phosphoglycerate mutase family protein [Jannaschia sp. GRR-S6-38]WGH78127.1 phosphoglycerate mutase family protein [Jannaschia sp. GRR-S6-38]
MKLIFLRHAHAKHGGVDFDRPLKRAGHDEAARLGQWLRAQDHVPTRILCSAARRTRETAAALDLPAAEIAYRDDLYGATATKIDTLATPAPGETLMIVAHNPGICEAAHAALRRPPDHLRFAAFPPCACLVVDAADGLPGRCLAFVVPGDF